MITRTTKLTELTSTELEGLQELLAKLGLYPSNQIDGLYGRNTAIAWKAFKESKYLGDVDLIGEASYKLLVESVKQDSPLITRRHFDACFRYATPAKRDRFFLPINKALKEFDINTLPRIAAFLAQLAHESCSLRYEEEIASGAAYEGRRDLGNVYQGDGRRYKGRGIIQLTGRSNYRTIGKALGLGLENNPLLAIEPNNSARIAGYFWKSRGLNEIADRNTLEAFRRITKLINGGQNGIQDRLTHWSHMKRVLGC